MRHNRFASWMDCDVGDNGDLRKRRRRKSQISPKAIAGALAAALILAVMAMNSGIEISDTNNAAESQQDHVFIADDQISDNTSQEVANIVNIEDDVTVAKTTEKATADNVEELEERIAPNAAGNEWMAVRTATKNQAGTFNNVALRQTAA